MARILLASGEPHLDERLLFPLSAFGDALLAVAFDVTQPHWATEVEATVLESMNAALAATDGPPLARVGELFAAPVRLFLLTYPQLDHYAR